jgi:hypothetical protein
VTSAGVTKFLGVPYAEPPAGAAKCRVETGSAACDVVDVAVLKRRLQSLGPGIAQACAAANPA